MTEPPLTCAIDHCEAKLPPASPHNRRYCLPHSMEIQRGRKPRAPAPPRQPRLSERVLALLDDGPVTTDGVKLALDVEWPTAFDALDRLRLRGEVERTGHHRWRRREPQAPAPTPSPVMDFPARIAAGRARLRPETFTREAATVA